MFSFNSRYPYADRHTALREVARDIRSSSPLLYIFKIFFIPLRCFQQNPEPEYWLFLFFRILAAYLYLRHDISCPISYFSNGGTWQLYPLPRHLNIFRLQGKDRWRGQILCLEIRQYCSLYTRLQYVLRPVHMRLTKNVFHYTRVFHVFHLSLICSSHEAQPTYVFWKMKQLCNTYGCLSN